MRACQPIRDGYIEREGIKVHLAPFHEGEPPLCWASPAHSGSMQQCRLIHQWEWAA
jgi:hypothetical protein